MFGKPILKIMDHPGYAAAVSRVEQCSAQLAEAQRVLEAAKAAAARQGSLVNKFDVERASQELERLQQECGEAVQGRSEQYEAACRAIEESMAKADAVVVRAYYMAIVAAGKAFDELDQRNKARAEAGSNKQLTTGFVLRQYLGDPGSVASHIHRELKVGLLCGAIIEKDLPAHWIARKIAAQLVA